MQLEQTNHRVENENAHVNYDAKGALSYLPDWLKFNFQVYWNAWLETF